jgi:hypothetical protein
MLNLSQYLPGGTEENYEKSQSGSRPRYVPRTSRLRSGSANYLAAAFGEMRGSSMRQANVYLVVACVRQMFTK